jgi:hypothetical protein
MQARLAYTLASQAIRNDFGYGSNPAGPGTPRACLEYLSELPESLHRRWTGFLRGDEQRSSSIQGHPRPSV